ncbi:hypothetical protein ACQ27_gp565 [Klebsiella phage K64-1]|nr:hypothetical protein ACQ27_gp565 [Klebsiella phage K64-1]
MIVFESDLMKYNGIQSTTINSFFELIK